MIVNFCLSFDACFLFEFFIVLMVFIDEVERQLDRKVKVVTFDRGGEFYGKFNESVQCLGPFA